MYARGTICGLTRGAGRNHIVRAALESIAYQTNDLINAMQSDAGITVTSLKADGGASKNKFLMQFQADISNTNVICPDNAEATALGAALLAGITAGIIKDTNNINTSATTFTPRMESDERSHNLSGWKRAVNSTISFTKE